MAARAVVLGVLASFPLSSCKDTATPEPIPAAVVVLLGTPHLDPSDTTRATVTAKDASGRDLAVRSVTFTSSNAAVARVDTAGIVTAIAEGPVSIAGTVRGISGNASLVVSHTVATVTVSSPRSTIEADDTTRVTVTAISVKGVTVTGRTVTYSTSNPAVATVSTSGLVRGVIAGTTTISATVDNETGAMNVTIQTRVASVRASEDSIRLSLQGSAQLSAQAFDADGNELQGRTITWTSADAGLASVSLSGLVTWRGPGRTVVVARAGSAVDTVRVAVAGDFAITGVHLSQGVQEADVSIPLIAQGGAAAVQVLMSSPVSTNTSAKIVLRIVDAAGALVFSDTETVTSLVGPSPSLMLPAAQFLVPASHLLAGRRWQVLRDPMGEVPDDSVSNDAYPRNGTTPLVLSDVPTLNIRFVPITLSAHGGSTPPVSNADLPGYLRTALSSLPLGQVATTIAPPFTTTASFGAPPSGGGQTFWVQVLQELDAARVASADPTIHWYGIVGPPAGFNFTQFGGFGFIPTDPAASGAGTRTALGVRTNWFFNQTQARDLVAHELAHNFGRRHSPCGNPGSLDPSYPRPDGRLGETMHDVYAWASGLTSTLQQVSAQTGDIMGYCFPGWSSSYTYRGVLDTRGPVATAQSVVRDAARREEVVVVQGMIAADGKPVLSFPLSLLGFRTATEAGGEYRLQGVDEAGRMLFEQPLHPASVDHADVRLFTVALPLDATMTRVRTLRVTGPGGTATLTTSAAVAAPNVRPDGDNAITVTCPDALARIAVQDARTNDLLGIAIGPVRIASARGKLLGVSCAKGALPRRALVQAP